MDIEETADDLALETAAKTEVKEDEVRANIIAEYGFNETDDVERIDKLTKKEMDGHKKLSQAIGQKIKYRDAAKAAKPEPKVEPKPAAEQGKQPEAVDVDAAVKKQFEQRDLEALDASDDIKKEIQRVSQIQGISITQAARDPYIVHKLDEWKKEQSNEAATIGKTRGGGGSKKTYTIDAPPNVDMTTKEGRDEWDAYKKAMKDAGN